MVFRRIFRRGNLSIRNESGERVQRTVVSGVVTGGDLSVEAIQREFPAHICPDCGWLVDLCAAKSSDPNHCWRWDEETP
jgi:hypothetical protein